MSFQVWCSMLRNDIKGVSKEVKALYAKTQAGGLWAEPTADDEPDGLKTEMIANTILCYRHLEDAAMRLGKRSKQRMVVFRSTINKLIAPSFQ